MMSQREAPLPSNIQEAARRLVAQRGRNGFTMADLARESGMARATLYRQAGSREEVLAFLAAQGVDLGERQDVQDRILQGARRVFTRAGFDGATLEEVAREAEVGVATVYRQFGDKEGLVRAFGDRFGPRRAVLAVAISPSGDLRADLERLAAAALRAAFEDLDLLKLALLERLRGGAWAELMRASPLSSKRTLARLLKSYLEQGELAEGDPRQMAQAFSGLLLSFVTTPLLEGKPMPDPDETARFITRLFLDGLAAPSRRRP